MQSIRLYVVVITIVLLVGIAAILAWANWRQGQRPASKVTPDIKQMQKPQAQEEAAPLISNDSVDNSKVKEPDQPESSPLATASGSLVYHNKTYEFAMQFSSSWRKINTREIKENIENCENSNTIIFGTPDDPSLFFIKIIEKLRCNNNFNKGAINSTFLAENSRYLFFYNSVKYTDSSDGVNKLYEVDSITKSFTLIR